MISRKRMPLLFSDMEPHKKRTLLAVLITLSWTASAALLLAGLYAPGRLRFLEAAAFFISGLVFLDARRSTGVATSSGIESRRS